MSEQSERMEIPSGDLLGWLSRKAREWERVRHDDRNTPEQKKYAEGCMMGFLAVEAWVQTYKPNDSMKRGE